MATRGGRPYEGRKRAFWKTVQPEPKQQFLAHVAGDAIRVRGHVGAKTKCCLSEYYPRYPLCPGCVNKWRVDDFFYLPCYRKHDDFAIITVFTSRWFEVIDSLKTHQCVKIGKGSGKNEGAYLLLQPDEPLYVPTRSDREAAADISDVLPVLWNYRGAITGDVLLRGPLQQPTPEVQTAEGEGEKQPALAPKEELRLSVDLISDSLGMTPPGSAREKRDARNRAFIEETKSKAGTNGTH